ncbi:hypothetical protein [Helicobacter pylori]|uniref:hypothetical protein n=1 Tax=Helicobacter pylori TaxID=210 RepID=UPI000EAC83D2|nr:hypothetical protein [Helicobacter pylori]
MAIRFGVIFIDNNIDNFFNDRRKTKQQLIRSILERKSGLDFIRFIEATASYTNLERKRKLSFEECAVFYTDADFVRIEREITSFLVFQNDRSVTLNNDPSATFNLKNYLLVLAKKFYCSVCYCENINTQKIEWISTNHSDFGEILQEFSDITSLSPNELPQFLADLKDKIIEFNFHKKIINNNLPFGIIFIVSDPENLIDINDKNKKLESCFHYYENSHLLYFPIITESYLILDNLKSYFIFQNENEKPFNLKQHLLELKKELGFEPSGIFYCENASTHKIELVSNFIFDVDNSSQLTIKVPRKDLENYELPNTKKDIFNKLINIRTIDENLILKNNKEITNDLNPLLGQLKTQEFPLSDAITKAINQKEKGIALDYALINDIKYNLLDNTFHFIFDVGNSLLKESSQLIIEVPREALDLENVDRLIENTLSPYETHSVYSESSLVYHLNQGSYIIDLHLIDD